MTATVPRAEVDAVADLRMVARTYRYYATDPSYNAQTPEQYLAEADALDALADRYELKAAR